MQMSVCRMSKKYVEGMLKWTPATAAAIAAAIATTTSIRNR